MSIRWDPRPPSQFHPVVRRPAPVTRDAMTRRTYRAIVPGVDVYPEPHVTMAGGYGLNQLERAIRDLRPILDMDEPQELLIDLGGLAHIGPAALALLAAVLKRREEEGFSCEVIPPRSPLTRNYLQRMDFTKLLFDDEIPEPFKRKKAVGFRPVQHFRGEDECWLAAKELAEALVERFKPDSIATAAIRICLDELAENVVHHAYTDLGGFAAAQSNPKRHTFEIAIVDLGIGIRASLARNPAYADISTDVEAVSTALQPRVSSTPERNAGIGLYITKLLLRGNGGQLLVRSGHAVVCRGANETEEENDMSFPGTIVAIRAHTNAPLDIDQVYRELSEHDGQADDDQAS
jgi:anti-sigma regulatory factor (Ser/Thr protein kinase)